MGSKIKLRTIICFIRVVSQTVEFVPVLQEIFATQLFKKDSFHSNQQFDHGGPQTHRMKVVTAKQSTSMESTPPT